MTDGRKNIQSTFEQIRLIEQIDMNVERTYF